MDFAQGISQFINAVGDRMTPLLLAIAGIGTLSMAVIQTLKDLTPARRRFNEWFVTRWIHARSRDVSAPEAERQLIALATAGDAKAFYDLPVEQMCGQANAAAQLVLEYPDRYEALLRVLGASGDPHDLEVLLETGRSRRLAGEAPPEPRPRSQAEVDARTRLTSLVQRSLDGLQISASAQWRFLLQGIAFLLSYTFTIVGVSMYSQHNASGRQIFSTILVGLAAGFLAPIARDLVAALQRARG